MLSHWIAGHPPFARNSSARLVCVFLAGLICIPAAATPVVWTGLTHSFSKASMADPTLPENQDRLTDLVVLTRGNAGGIYNVVTETIFNFATSPADTRWATDINNAGKTIAATNWADLTFESWTTAYGGQVGMTIVNRDAVMHLVTDDVYLDVRFTAWGMGSGGGTGGGGSFTYLRAEPPGVVPTGDYNLNGTVDAPDYVVWRNTLGDSVDNGTGADGSANGVIDAADHAFWASHFGNPAASAASVGTIPEPCTVALVVFGLGAVVGLVRRH